MSVRSFSRQSDHSDRPPLLPRRRPQTCQFGTPSQSSSRSFYQQFSNTKENENQFGFGDDVNFDGANRLHVGVQADLSNHQRPFTPANKQATFAYGYVDGPNFSTNQIRDQRTRHPLTITRTPRDNRTQLHQLYEADLRRSLRVGNGGSSWRHIRQCVGYGGNLICFLDGSVKLKDCSQFPPTGYPDLYGNCGRQSVNSGQFTFRCSPMPRIMGQCDVGREPLVLSRAPTPRTRTTVTRPVTALQHNGWDSRTSCKKLTPTTIQGRIMKSGCQY